MDSLRSCLGGMVVACGLLLVAGSLGHAADGKVTGEVRVNGKPLASGRIFFHLENGQFVGAKVKDGKYAVSRVPAGTRKISVEGKGVPAAFASEETTSLQVEIKGGAATHDIDLRP